MIEVYASRSNSPAAAAFVARMRAEGKLARENNSAWFDPAQVDRDAVRVYHDGSDQRIPDTYARLGIPCELLPGAEPETVPADEPAGHSVRQTGRWYSLIGPDGTKIGKSQESEAEAWALLKDGS